MIILKRDGRGGGEEGYAEVRVKFYDKEGAVIATFLDNINDLGPGEVWNFEVMYPGTDVEKVGSYKIAVGSVF